MRVAFGVEPEPVIVSVSIDDQYVALPLTNGVTVPGWPAIELGFMLPAVGENVTLGWNPDAAVVVP